MSALFGWIRVFLVGFGAIFFTLAFPAVLFLSSLFKLFYFQIFFLKALSIHIFLRVGACLSPHVP